MMRSNPASSMQKCYDDCFLVCSTAIYFEQQNNEAEALRSWKNALDQIYYHNAYRLPGSYRPRNETEKALQVSLKQLELQCKERVDLLEALKRSRAEAEEGKADGGVDNSLTSTLSATSTTSNGAGLGSGTVPPITYPDLARPPQLSKRPLPPAPRGSSGSYRPDLPSRPSQLSEQNVNLLTPTVTPVEKRRSRTPSPEKKGGMLRTLRPNKLSGSAARPKRPSSKSQAPVAATGAASSAWGGISRPVSQTISTPTLLAEPARASLSGSMSNISTPPGSARDSLSRPLVNHSQTNSALDADLGARLSLSDDRSPQRRVDRPAPITRTQAPTAMIPPSYDVADIPMHKASSAPAPAPARRRRSKTPPRVSNTGLPSLSYRKEFPEASKGIDAEIAIEQARRLRGLGPASAASATSPIQDGQVRRKAVNHKPQANTKIVRNTRTGSEDDFSSSSNEHTNRTPLKPRHLRANAPLERPLTPSSEASVEIDPEMNSPDRVWQAKVKGILKKLPRGVDETAAKQILNEIVIQGDEVHWADVAGLDIAKNALKETVVYPFLRPDLFSGLREPARGMLLFGPPGTGKTMLARAVATESRSTFFAISASSLTSKFLGESEKLVRALFALAKELAPSIIFVDEIDSLLSSRSDQGEHEATRRIKTEFLIQWSDLARAAAGRESDNKERGDASRVLVLAATNLPWAIDEAARRRFVRRQYIPLPEVEVRATQLKTLLSHQKHSLTARDLSRLVTLTEGFSGSDITALAKDAAMGPLRSLGERLLHTTMDEIRPIGFQDFQASLITIRPSVSKQGLKQFEEWAAEYGERGG